MIIYSDLGILSRASINLLVVHLGAPSASQLVFLHLLFRTCDSGCYSLPKTNLLGPSVGLFERQNISEPLWGLLLLQNLDLPPSVTTN